MFDYYEVKPFWLSPSSIESSITRIYNSLAQAINESKHLPRYIVMLLDLDALKDMAYYGSRASQVIGKGLSLLINDIVSEIENQKSKMHKIKPGSVIVGEPKMLWVALINKPHYQKVMSLRRKYNEILEDTLTNYRNCHIIHPTPLLKHYFDRANYLSCDGMIAFWKDIDEILKNFDQAKDQRQELKPQKTKFIPSINEQKRKLPSPPPNEGM